MCGMSTRWNIIHHKELNRVAMLVEPLGYNEISQTQKENHHVFGISMCACVTFNFKNDTLICVSFLYKENNR